MIPIVYHDNEQVEVAITIAKGKLMDGYAKRDAIRFAVYECKLTKKETDMLVKEMK